MKILANELAFPIREDRQCHASHFARLADGSILLVFFYGSREGNDDVRIYGCRRDPVSGAWSEPAAITEDDGLPHWNPVLLPRADGALVLFYKVGKPIADWKTRCMISYDGGYTWSLSFEMIEGDESGGRGPVRNKAIYLRDGTLLAPGSTEKGEWKCFFDRSTDGGKTWERSRDLTVPKGMLEKYGDVTGKGIIQPTLWESREGVHALMRSSEGVLFRTDSKDGILWCDPYPTDVPNNNSGVDLCTLPDGRLLLCCNPVGDNWGARSPISLLTSDDNGNSFSLLTHLITMKGEFSYPAIQYLEGKIHITFTWNRRSIQYFCLSEIE